MNETEIPEENRTSLERLQERKKYRKDIVVIEDKEEEREALRALIEECGYTVLAIKDSRKTISLLDSQKLSWIPEAVILNLVLDASSGYDLLRSMIQRFQAKKVPVIVVSSMATPQDIFEAQTAGADAYVVRPFKEDDLREALEFSLENVKKPAIERMSGIFVKKGDS